MALGGWLVATLAVSLALVAWRSLTVRMDAVARACHELRGPITAARLGLQLGTRAGQLSPVRLQAIDVELGRAALALDDLAGAGVEHYAAGAVDVCAVAADSVEAWSGVAASRGVALRLCSGSGADATVLGDRFRLAQALGNLVANAIEHGREFVEVSCTVTADVVRIDVADGGHGLPAPVALLAGGSGARRRRRRRTGRGHGLAVALAVAEAHGGRLAAAPAQRGARVVLELPLARRRAGAARPG